MMKIKKALKVMMVISALCSGLVFVYWFFGICFQMFL